MNRKVCIALLATVMTFGTQSVLAEPETGQNYINFMGTFIDDDTDRGADDDFTPLDLRLGRVLSDTWNMELHVLSADIDGFNAQEQLTVGLNLLRVWDRESRFSPFVHFGAGSMSVNPENQAGGSQTGFMYSGGVGFMLDLFSSDAALRAEYRHRIDEAFDDTLSDNLFSVGFVLPFGDTSPKVVDTDGDGVIDGIDRCPNTPPGTPVGPYGCELDSDRDGVKDSMDECPDTPLGTPVDSKGCPLDSDGDGVTDDKDECPNTVAGAKVDEKGCELDSDNDGVVDRLDECPNTREGAQVDIKGCEIKEEIALKGVNFETNSDRLLPSATSVLNDAAATLRKNPTIKVEVAGHTDSDGAAEYNEGLSARRAQTVADFLANNGVAEDRLSVRGYGESQPIASNATAEGKAENRRVVLRIVER